MTKKVMLINATDSEEIRVATLVEGVLSDFDIESVHNTKIKGNIYKARIVRVDSSLQAAFIHYGGQKNGFLPIGELPRDLVSPSGRRGRIQELLQRDQEIMVQAVREELGSKGAMMTAQISLPGRYLVLTPGNPTNGISRKIESREEREYFKALIDELDIPKDMGVIVRTASLGVTKEDFQRDLEYLLDTHREVLARYRRRPGVGLVWQEDDVVTRTLRDAFSADMEEVNIDDLETFQAAQAFFKRTMPQHLGVLKHYVGKKPLFSRFQTEEQIDRIYARKVPLPSGGTLAIDQAEALVAIDVNSGRTSGEGVEDMAFKTNMEAAEEVARQLRLRDLAGLVAIDFIDMKREGNNRAVMERLVECLKEDKARMEVGKINRFGVLVMTRQRIRPSLQHVTHEACPTCQGTGKVKNLDSLLLSVVRRLKAILSRGDVAELRVKLAPAIAMAVLNQKRKALADLEEAHEARILVLADPEVGYGEMAAEIERCEEEVAPKPERAAMTPIRDAEDDTVVLGGDSPVSFEKALGEDSHKIHGSRHASEAEIKYDQRDVQRAAIEERERLRALFESARPGEEELDPAVPEALEATEPAKKPARRRGRGAKAKAAPSVAETATMDEAPSVPETLPEPPVLTADLLASLAMPASRPRLSPTPEPVVAVMDAEPPAKPKRGRPAKAKTDTEAKKEKASAAPRKRATKTDAEAPKAKTPRSKKKPEV